MTTKVALIGAGGKMGCRITDNISQDNSLSVAYVEISEAGIKNLQARGLDVTPQTTAVPEADVVILAVPDVAIEKISHSFISDMKAGSMLFILDPAAAYLGKLPEREDVTYFGAHPCHPPVFNYVDSPETRKDFFGGIDAHQAVVCTLIQGPDDDYSQGEMLAKKMFAPVVRTHRITLEQMATLEPTMAETIGAAVATRLKEAMDEAVARGVPYEAARDFMLGHINIELAIAFGEAGNPFSDAALVAIEYGKQKLFSDGWKYLFEPENIKEQIRVMLNPSLLQKN